MLLSDCKCILNTINFLRYVAWQNFEIKLCNSITLFFSISYVFFCLISGGHEKDDLVAYYLDDKQISECHFSEKC